MPWTTLLPTRGGRPGLRDTRGVTPYCIADVFVEFHSLALLYLAFVRSLRTTLSLSETSDRREHGAPSSHATSTLPTPLHVSGFLIADGAVKKRVPCRTTVRVPSPGNLKIAMWVLLLVLARYALAAAEPYQFRNAWPGRFGRGNIRR